LAFSFCISDYAMSQTLLTGTSDVSDLRHCWCRVLCISCGIVSTALIRNQRCPRHRWYCFGGVSTTPWLIFLNTSSLLKPNSKNLRLVSWRKKIGRKYCATVPLKKHEKTREQQNLPAEDRKSGRETGDSKQAWDGIHDNLTCKAVCWFRFHTYVELAVQGIPQQLYTNLLLFRTWIHVSTYIQDNVSRRVSETIGIGYSTPFCLPCENVDIILEKESQGTLRKPLIQA
jgi:hypothetical protein